MGIGDNTRQIIIGRLAKSNSLSEIDYCLELWVQTHSFRHVHFIGLTSQLAFNRRAFFIHSQDPKLIEDISQQLNSDEIIKLRQSIILGQYQNAKDMFSGLNMHVFPVHGQSQAAGLFLVQGAHFKPLTKQEEIFIAQELYIFQDAIFAAYLPKFLQNISLTRREAEVLSWVAQGKSNNVIAEIMGVSPHTIDNYMRRTYTKIGVNNRTSAAVKALLLGLTSI